MATKKSPEALRYNKFTSTVPAVKLQALKLYLNAFERNISILGRSRAHSTTIVVMWLQWPFTFSACLPNSILNR